MSEWVAVAQVVGTIAVAQPLVTPEAYASMPQYPDAPNLHWGLLLLFGFLSCGLFIIVWEFVQTAWMKRVEPQSKALLYNAIYVALWFLNLVISIGNAGFTSSHRGGTANVGALTGVAALITIGYIVMLIVYRFSMRSSLEKHFTQAEPIGLTLGGVMTFFFGSLYFQYHLNRMNEIKRAYRLSNPY